MWPGSDEVGTAGSWGIGFLLSSLVYGLLYQSWGWRGMLWIGILPAFVLLYVRFFVKEPEVWVENRRLRKAHQREVKASLFSTSGAVCSATP